MSVLWEIPLNFSSTHVHLPLNYTFSSVICQKMDSGPTRLEEWWEWMRQREGVHSTESLAPFISQISTFNLLFRKKLKIWLTTMSLLCHTDVSHCSPAGLGKGMEVIWQSDAFFCVIRDTSNASRAKGYSLNPALRDVKKLLCYLTAKRTCSQCKGLLLAICARTVREEIVGNKIGNS